MTTPLSPLQRAALHTLGSIPGTTASQVRAALSHGATPHHLTLDATTALLGDLAEQRLVVADLDAPTRWRLTVSGLQVAALDGERRTVSPLEADLLLELDKVALATDAGPGDTLRRVIREAATVGELRTALADALMEWLYCADYKGDFLMAKHRDAEQVAAYRERFGIAAPEPVALPVAATEAM